MKNRLEAELISIAHRILKLKNKSEVIQLQQEALNLYEKLSVLRFVEENYDDSSVEIPVDIEEKLEEISVETTKSVSHQEIEQVKEEIVVEPVREEEKQKEDNPILDSSVQKEEREEESPKIEDFQVRFEDFEAQLSNAKPTKTPSIFDEVFETEEPVFVPVKPTSVEQSEVKKAENTLTEPSSKNVSINEAVRKNFNIGLNDRIAFEFHLFGGQTEDFNRVLSQLNTFETFAEAKDFIENVVKPDYNNWLAKEEYENRFLEIIESKF